MTEQNTKNWLEQEADNLKQPLDFEKLPSLKLSPNVVTEINIDFVKPFEEWTGEDVKGQPVKKKIIPVLVAGTKMNFWLNVKNPLYREIITLGKEGQKVFKVLQTGTQANTKYVLVK